MKNHRSCGLVMLLFFLVYAASPLTYKLTTGSHTAAAALEASAHSFSSATLYLLEALYAAIARSDDHDQDLPAHRILIRKKWAVHRGNNNIASKVAHTRYHLAAALDHHQAVTIFAGLANLIQPWTEKSDEYLPLSSGLSPPFLS